MRSVWLLDKRLIKRLKTVLHFVLPTSRSHFISYRYCGELTAGEIPAKTPALRFRVDGKHFENGAFRERWCHDNHVISLTEFSSNTNPKWPLIVAFLNFSRPVWTENIWYVFGENLRSVFKFLPRSVAWARVNLKNARNVQPRKKTERWIAWYKNLLLCVVLRPVAVDIGDWEQSGTIWEGAHKEESLPHDPSNKGREASGDKSEKWHPETFVSQ